MTWPTKKLGEIARVFAGSSAPQGKEYFVDGKYFFVRVSDLAGQKIENLVTTRDQINDFAVNELRPVLAKEGTILFPKSGAAINTNSRAILGVDAYIVSHLAAIEAKKEILPKWIYYFLLDFDMRTLSANGSYPSLQLSQIKEILIPLPPLEKQKKIVARLDLLSAKIRELQKLQSETEKDLKELKQAILQKAFSGEL